MRFLAGRRMSGPANHDKREDDPTGPLQYTFHSHLSNPAEAGHHNVGSDYARLRCLVRRTARSADVVSILRQADEVILNVDTAVLGKEDP